MSQEQRIEQMQQTISNLQYQIEQLTNRVMRAELSAISVNPMYTDEERMKAGKQLDAILSAEKEKEELAARFK